MVVLASHLTSEGILTEEEVASYQVVEWEVEFETWKVELVDLKVETAKIQVDFS